MCCITENKVIQSGQQQCLHLHNPETSDSDGMNYTKYLRNLLLSDRPGGASVEPVEDFLLKGGSGHFLCLLEDLGFPEAEHFTWKL